MKKNNTENFTVWTTIVRPVIIAIILFCLILILFSCNGINKICVSTKTVPVVYITKSGDLYKFNIPYCDTIRLNNDKIDSVQAVKLNKRIYENRRN
jgi:hypothetical protein